MQAFKFLHREFRKERFVEDELKLMFTKCKTRELEYGFTWSHDEFRIEPAKVLKYL